MNPMVLRETTIVLILLAVAPVALAQEADPTVNESDYDTSEPTSDESYLDASAQEAGIEEEPTVSEADFDTAAPTYDESYLDDAEAEAAGADTAKGAPGIGLLAGLAAVAVAALALWRRK